MTPTTDRFADALSYASRLHSDQFRKGTDIPYVSHLLAVAAIVLEQGGDEDQAIAGLLHDAVEDQGGAKTLAAIESRYGGRVADIVDACSDTDQVPKPPWLERKQAYLDHLRAVPAEVLLVSAADKFHNASSMLRDLDAVGDALWERFNASRSEQQWYYSELVRVFRERMPGPLTEALAGVVDDLFADPFSTLLRAIEGRRVLWVDPASGMSDVEPGLDRLMRHAGDAGVSAPIVRVGTSASALLELGDRPNGHWDLIITHWGHGLAAGDGDSVAEELLTQMRRRGVEAPVVVFAGGDFADQNRRQALGLGAFDYTYQWQALADAVARALAPGTVTGR